MEVSEALVLIEKEQACMNNDKCGLNCDDCPCNVERKEIYKLYDFMKEVLNAGTRITGNQN